MTKGSPKLLRWLCAILAVAALMGTALNGTAFADTDTVVAIPDANLQAALLSITGDSDGSFTEGELQALRGNLDLSGRNICSIEGLQYATGISGLNLSGNLLRDITPLGSFSLIPIDLTDNCLNTTAGSTAMTTIAALQGAGCTVTYNLQKTPAAGISLNHNSLVLCVDDTATLTATVAPEDATVQTVIWSSDNNEIVSVTDGTITAVDMGTANVRAVTQDGGFEAICAVTVKAGKIGSSKYRVGSETISGVAKYTGVNTFIANLYNDASELCVYKADGTVLTSGSVATGMTVALTVEGVERDRLAIIINGDATGDGVISISDYTLARLDILGLKKLEGAYRTAADVNEDGNVSISDYTLMRLDILGLKLINGSGSSLPDLPEVSDSRIKAYIAIALAQQGDPYVLGDEGPDTFDCSGLVYYSLRESGYPGTLWRSSADTYSKWADWLYVDSASLQPGDILFFRSEDNPSRIGHTGIYLGNNYFVHASSSYGRVTISKLEGWYSRQLSHGRRVYY